MKFAGVHPRSFSDNLRNGSNEGTREIEGMLKNFLFDDYLQLEKWEEPQRKIALRALADALPYVKRNLDLDDFGCVPAASSPRRRAEGSGFGDDWCN